MQTYDDKSQTENVHGLKRELEQWRTRYNFVVSENAILSRQNKELEIEVSLNRFWNMFGFKLTHNYIWIQIKRFQKQVDTNGEQILAENNQLRDELDKIKQNFKPNNVRSYSPSKTDPKQGLEMQKLKKENEKLKEYVLREIA